MRGGDAWHGRIINAHTFTIHTDPMPVSPAPTQIADLGLTQQLNNSGTAACWCIGTEGYASPEQRECVEVRVRQQASWIEDSWYPQPFCPLATFSEPPCTHPQTAPSLMPASLPLVITRSF